MSRRAPDPCVAADGAGGIVKPSTYAPALLLSKADTANATLQVTLRVLLGLTLVFLAVCVVGWEGATAHACYRSGTFEVEKAVHTMNEECDNAAHSRDYRERQMRTEQCQLAQHIKAQGAFQVVLECVLSRHTGTFGRCKELALCNMVLELADTFRKWFVLLLITVCCASLALVRFLYHYERDGFELFRTVWRGARYRDLLERGLPPPAVEDKKVV